MEGNVQHVVKPVSKFVGKNADDFLEWSFKLRVSLSLYSKPIFEIVQESQRPSDLNNDQVIAHEGWDDTILICSASFTSRYPAQLSMSRGGLKKNSRGRMRAWRGRMDCSTRDVRRLLARGLTSGAPRNGNRENTAR